MIRAFLILISLSVLACTDTGSAMTPQGDGTLTIQTPNAENVVTETLRISYRNESRSKDINIYGHIIAPEGYQNRLLPVVILSPGFGNSLDFIAGQYAADIARLGFITYSFEFYGGNHGSRSGGQMTEMSPFTEVEDLTAVLNALRNRAVCG